MKVEEFKKIRMNLKEQEVLILKFGAEWCNPCKKIKPLVNTIVKTLPTNVKFVEIDIDVSVELYVAFKSKKMIKGVPTILAFRGDSDNDLWYIPDEIVSGSNEKAISSFFKEAINI